MNYEKPEQSVFNSKCCVFCILFTLLMFPIGCDQTSSHQSSNIASLETVEMEEIVEPQETAQIAEDTPESNDKEIVLLSSYDDWNLLIGFMNTSSANNPIDIKAYIDDTLVVNQDIGYSEHRSTSFYFKLDEGEHLLKVESQKGEASLNQTFEAKRKQYTNVTYYYRPGGNNDYSAQQFRFTIQDRPFILM